MKIKLFINVVIPTCLCFTFQVHAFDLGDVSGKLLASSKKASQTKPKNNVVSNANLPKFNVRGMYLGMPVPDAVAILSNYNPPLKVTKNAADISIIKGSRLAGLRFLYTLRGEQIQNRTVRSIDNFTLTASPPKNAEVIMGIRRNQHLGDNQVLLSDMKDLFTQKYGKPVFELRPSTAKRNPFYILSWSLKPNGKPQKDKTIISQCLAGAAAVMTKAKVKARNRLNYQQCGFTFIVRMDTGNVDYSERTTTYSYTTIFYDGNKIRKAVDKTIAYTEKVAKKLEEEKMKKLRGTKKPQL